MGSFLVTLELFFFTVSSFSSPQSSSPPQSSSSSSSFIFATFLCGGEPAFLETGGEFLFGDLLVAKNLLFVEFGLSNSAGLGTEPTKRSFLGKEQSAGEGCLGGMDLRCLGRTGLLFNPFSKLSKVFCACFLTLSFASRRRGEQRGKTLFTAVGGSRTDSTSSKQQRTENLISWFGSERQVSYASRMRCLGAFGESP